MFYLDIILTFQTQKRKPLNSFINFNFSSEKHTRASSRFCNIYRLYNYLISEWGRGGGGQVFSVLAFYSNNTSSNPA